MKQNEGETLPILHVGLTGLPLGNQQIDLGGGILLRGADTVFMSPLVLVNLRGADLTCQMNDVLYVLSCCEPEIFSERGQINLHSLASLAARRTVIEPDTTTFSVVSKGEDCDGTQRIWIERRCRDVPAGQRRFWKSAYTHACSVGGGDLDNVIASYNTR